MQGKVGQKRVRNKKRKKVNQFRVECSTNMEDLSFRRSPLLFMGSTGTTDSLQGKEKYKETRSNSSSECLDH